MAFSKATLTGSETFHVTSMHPLSVASFTTLWPLEPIPAVRRNINLGLVASSSSN